MMPRLLLLVILLPALACGRVSDREARTLVERYNQVVCEAYRRCDIQLIDSVVAPDCVAGKNLTGLIGVRLDMGLALDARLEALEITSVQPQKDGLEIRTKERWSYLDRRLGTGEPVGEASVDHYEILYRLKQVQGGWMVTETQFAAPPQVGRQAVPWSMDAKEAHAMVGPAKGAKP